MKYFKKKAMAAALGAAAAVMISFPALAGWNQDEKGWSYTDDSGNPMINTWLEQPDEWYFLDEQGYMVSNCYRKIGAIYYGFDKQGAWTGDIFPDIEAGAWNGRTYVNSWSGLTMTVPESALVFSASQMGIIGKSSMFQEFGLKVNDGTNAVVQLGYEYSGNLDSGSETTIEAYGNLAAVQLYERGYVPVSFRPVNLQGRDYYKLSATKGGVEYCDLYIRKTEGYFEVLSASYGIGSVNQVDKILAGVR
ncbi:MAG: hypothetical protein Q4E86_11460 [Lachnospiraceae bacterium]|nr:hypothetical protein [Lachnospiraceae bacterium]